MAPFGPSDSLDGDVSAGKSEVKSNLAVCDGDRVYDSELFMGRSFDALPSPSFSDQSLPGNDLSVNSFWASIIKAQDAMLEVAFENGAGSVSDQGKHASLLREAGQVSPEVTSDWLTVDKAEASCALGKPGRSDEEVTSPGSELDFMSQSTNPDKQNAKNSEEKDNVVETDSVGVVVVEGEGVGRYGEDSQPEQTMSRTQAERDEDGIKPGVNTLPGMSGQGCADQVLSSVSDTLAVAGTEVSPSDSDLDKGLWSQASSELGKVFPCQASCTLDKVSPSQVSFELDKVFHSQASCDSDKVFPCQTSVKSDKDQPQEEIEAPLNLSWTPAEAVVVQAEKPVSSELPVVAATADNSVLEIISREEGKVPRLTQLCVDACGGEALVECLVLKGSDQPTDMPGEGCLILTPAYESCPTSATAQKGHQHNVEPSHEVCANQEEDVGIVQPLKIHGTGEDKPCDDVEQGALLCEENLKNLALGGCAESQLCVSQSEPAVAQDGLQDIISTSPHPEDPSSPKETLQDMSGCEPEKPPGEEPQGDGAHDGLPTGGKVHQELMTNEVLDAPSCDTAHLFMVLNRANNSTVCRRPPTPSVEPLDVTRASGDKSKLACEASGEDMPGTASSKAATENHATKAEVCVKPCDVQSLQKPAEVESLFVKDCKDSFSGQEVSVLSKDSPLGKDDQEKPCNSFQENSCDTPEEERAGLFCSKLQESLHCNNQSQTQAFHHISSSPREPGLTKQSVNPNKTLLPGECTEGLFSAPALSSKTGQTFCFEDLKDRQAFSEAEKKTCFVKKSFEAAKIEKETVSSHFQVKPEEQVPTNITGSGSAAEQCASSPTTPNACKLGPLQGNSTGSQQQQQFTGPDGGCRDGGQQHLGLELDRGGNLDLLDAQSGLESLTDAISLRRNEGESRLGTSLSSLCTGGSIGQSAQLANDEPRVPSLVHLSDCGEAGDVSTQRQMSHPVGLGGSEISGLRCESRVHDKQESGRRKEACGGHAEVFEGETGVEYQSLGSQVLESGGKCVTGEDDGSGKKIEQFSHEDTSPEIGEGNEVLIQSSETKHGCPVVERRKIAGDNKSEQHDEDTESKIIGEYMESKVNCMQIRSLGEEKERQNQIGCSKDKTVDKRSLLDALEINRGSVSEHENRETGRPSTTTLSQSLEEQQDSQSLDGEEEEEEEREEERKGEVSGQPPEAKPATLSRSEIHKLIFETDSDSDLQILSSERRKVLRFYHHLSELNSMTVSSDEEDGVRRTPQDVGRCESAPVVKSTAGRTRSGYDTDNTDGSTSSSSMSCIGEKEGMGARPGGDDSVNVHGEWAQSVFVVADAQDKVSEDVVVSTRNGLPKKEVSDQEEQGTCTVQADVRNKSELPRRSSYTSKKKKEGQKIKGGTSYVAPEPSQTGTPLSRISLESPSCSGRGAKGRRSGGHAAGGRSRQRFKGGRAKRSETGSLQPEKRSHGRDVVVRAGSSDRGTCGWSTGKTVAKPGEVTLSSQLGEMGCSSAADAGAESTTQAGAKGKGQSSGSGTNDECHHQGQEKNPKNPNSREGKGPKWTCRFRATSDWVLHGTVSRGAVDRRASVGPGSGQRQPRKEASEGASKQCTPPTCSRGSSWQSVGSSFGPWSRDGSVGRRRRAERAGIGRGEQGSKDGDKALKDRGGPRGRAGRVGEAQGRYGGRGGGKTSTHSDPKVVTSREGREVKSSVGIGQGKASGVRQGHRISSPAPLSKVKGRAQGHGEAHRRSWSVDSKAECSVHSTDASQAGSKG